MKTGIFRSVTAVLLVLMLTSVSFPATYAASFNKPSTWASQKMSICEKAGVIPEDFDSKPFTQSITRRDFCELLINACRISKIVIPELPAPHPFTDTTDTVIENSYKLGLVKGTASGIFSPEMPLTREMAAVMLSKMLMLFQSTSDGNDKNGTMAYPEPMSIEKATQLLKEYSVDYAQVSEWAKAYMADVYMLGILSGTGGGRLDPKSELTREQAAVLSLNALTYSDESKTGQQEFSISPRLGINEIITGDPEKNQFADIHDAESNMTKITVNVWNLTASGSKKSSTITLTVNKNVADDVKKIFEEIYDGKEKFPIKNCAAYAYRDGKSQHSNGTAIDINWEENYFISNEGVIKAGTLWKPGVNPYSILPDGDVVRAFNRYGWHWSPDMNWRNGKDYMHFSLAGK